MKTLEDIPQAYHRTLKFHQYIMTYTGLLRVRRALRQGDLVASSQILRQIKKGTSASDPEINFQVSMLEIEHLVRSGSLDAAFSKLEQWTTDLRENHADIYARVSVLNMKAKLYADMGKSQKAFTLAVRAASAAQRARILPAVWTAVGLIANVLNKMRESTASQRLLDSIIPQALEGGDGHQCAYLYAVQADVYLSMSQEANTRKHSAMLGKAEVYADLARERKSSVRHGFCRQLTPSRLQTHRRYQWRMRDACKESYHCQNAGRREAVRGLGCELRLDLRASHASECRGTGYCLMSGRELDAVSYPS
jgi:anaphase-promoting complex subunit 5